MYARLRHPSRPQVRLPLARWDRWGRLPNIRAREELPRHEPGDVVAIRELWDGRVWYARAGRSSCATNRTSTMLHVPPHVLCEEPVDARRSSRSGFPRIDGRSKTSRRGPTSMLSFAVPEHAVRGDHRASTNRR